MLLLKLEQKLLHAWQHVIDGFAFGWTYGLGAFFPLPSNLGLSGAEFFEFLALPQAHVDVAERITDFGLEAVFLAQNLGGLLCREAGRTEYCFDVVVG